MQNKLTKVSDYFLIDNDLDLNLYITELQQSKNRLLALDLEGNSNMHAYGTQLCLLQLYDGVRSVIVDPFNVDGGLLKVLLEDRNILKVMYDAPSDMSLLENTRDIFLNSILDLRPGVELLNYEKKDLHSIIFAELGIALEYKGKFQRYNWLRRPISKDALNYAINDVIHLFKLKDIVLNKLHEHGLLESFMLRNIRVQNRSYYIDPKDQYQKVKEFITLNGSEKPIFQRLHSIREKYAEKVDMPPAFLIPNKLLIDIARNATLINDIRIPRRFTESLALGIIEELREASR